MSRPRPSRHAANVQPMNSRRPAARRGSTRVRHAAPAEEPDAEYPLYLTTGRNLSQYQSGTQTRRIAELTDMTPAPLAELHPLTARRHGLNDGDPVRVSTRRGAADFTVKITRNIREDTVFAPFHWGGMQAVNRLTNPALDPTSRMPEFKVCAARIESITDVEARRRGE